MLATEFVQSICTALEIETAEQDDQGRYLFQFDGDLKIRLQLLGASSLRIEGDVAEIPEDPFRSERLTRKLLQRSLSRLHQQSEIVTINDANSIVCIYREVNTDNMPSAPSDAISIVEDFVNHLESWVADCTDVPASRYPTHMLRP